MIQVQLDFTKFDPAVLDVLQNQAPERARGAVTAAARAIARELRAASPAGGSPNATRAGLRAKKPGLYGPIRSGWRVSAAKANARSFRFSTNRRYALPPESAAVFVKTFYAGFVEFGHGPPTLGVSKRHGIASVGATLRRGRMARRIGGHGAAPHPFAQPVIDRAASVAQTAIASYLGK